MPGAFTAINLAQLPMPQIVERLDYEAILAEMLADLRARDPAFTATVESDPAYKILEVAAYRETLIRQRINDAARGVMLAYASGTDLDQIGANYGVSRLLVAPGNPNAVPPMPDVFEDDTAFRTRIQLSIEGYTTAGSVGAYVFFALSADGTVADVAVENPPAVPGTVEVRVLSKIGNGAASMELVQKVVAALNAEDVRPLCDTVNVASAEIVNYSISAMLTTFFGVGREEVLENARAAVMAYAKEQQKIGRDITRSGIFAALHQPGVQNVTLISPMDDIVIAWDQAPFATSISVTLGGENE